MTGVRARPRAIPAQATQHLQAAQSAQRIGDRAHAAREFDAAVRIAPDHPIVLNAAALQRLASGDLAKARRHLRRATEADCKAPELWLNLAKVEREAGDTEAERAALDGALSADRRHFGALVRSAEWHERAGRLGAAAADWSGVLQLAVALPPEQARQAEALLIRARQVVADWSGALGAAVDAGLDEVRAEIPPIDRRRFETCVDAALGRRRIYHPQPFGLQFPFLPAEEFVPRASLPFLPALERHAAAIRAEALQLLDAGGEGFAPYVANPPGTPPDKWSELDHSTRWSALYLWKYGRPDEAAQRRFPATAAALAEVPLNDMPGRGPTAFFSLLKTGTRIPPHTGVTNTRTIVHLPLIVPAGCGFRVGGETRAWRVGEAFGFDDTIEHEAWNDGDEPRVVLICDVWNPYLTEVERDLLRAYYRAADASGLNPEPNDI